MLVRPPSNVAIEVGMMSSFCSHPCFPSQLGLLLDSPDREFIHAHEFWTPDNLRRVRPAERLFGTAPQ